MQTIKETEHYALKIGPNPYDPNNQIEYLIFNKHTGVLEVDSRVGPQARKYFEELNEAWEYMDKEEKNESILSPTKKNIISFDRSH
jgi:hypothetical protein